MKDYIFCKNLKRKDLISEIESFYKSEFELTEFCTQLGEYQITFNGYVKSNAQRATDFRQFYIEGVLNAETISWTETDWNRFYQQPSDNIVQRVQYRLSSEITKHYTDRGYKILDDYTKTM